ncbi:MAG: DegT/DnrJ/EryC1/StrS family aminotransferase [bacterium]
MIPLAKPWFGPEEEAAVAEVLRSGWVAQGPTCARFEDEFATAVGVPHAISVSSCTTGLHLAVIACGVKPGDEVILPSYTFPATANAVLYEGAVPVVVDIEPGTLNVDPEAVEAAITPRTRAIIGVHLFGFPCDIVRLEEIAARHGVSLVEDAACAIGTRVDDRMAGAFGDVAVFSLHARKVVTCGEGGVLTTRDTKLAELVGSLRTHGADRDAGRRHAEGPAPTHAEYVRLGYNYRLSDIQAAVARVQLERLEAFVAEREKIAARYDAAFADLEGLRLPPRRAGWRHSYQSYVVVLEADSPVSPATFMEELARLGVSTRVGTYAVHRQPYFRERFGDRSLPFTEEAADRSVALPLFCGLPESDQARVVEAVRTVWSGVKST